MGLGSGRLSDPGKSPARESHPPPAVLWVIVPALVETGSGRQHGEYHTLLGDDRIIQGRESARSDCFFSDQGLCCPEARCRVLCGALDRVINDLGGSFQTNRCLDSDDPPPRNQPLLSSRICDARAVSRLASPLRAARHVDNDSFPETLAVPGVKASPAPKGVRRHEERTPSA